MIEGFASCVIALSEVELEATDTGWKEQATITVDAEGSCPWVDIPLPPGVTLERWKGRVSRVTGRSGKLKEDRAERIVRDLEGHGAVRVHTPELASGDRVILEIQRSWPAVAFPWRPGSQSFAEIEVDTAAPVPDWARDEDGSVWTQDAPADGVWSLPHPAPAPSLDALEAPTDPVDARLTYDLIVTGNPQLSLYPGGGSRYRSTWEIEGAAGDSRRGFVVPIEGRLLDVQGEHRVRDDSVVLIAESGQPFAHRVELEDRDAPTYGTRVELAGANVEQVVKGERVRVEWEGDDGWYVSAVDLHPLLPERPRLLIALDRRFRRMASPEPAVPTFLKGQPTTLDLVAQLKPALRERTGIGWPTADPLFPRKLVRSRNEHAMSTVEAALALWAELSQLQIPSAWGIVMPAPTGDGFFMSPAGYEVGVVGVKTPDGAVWIDPGCNLCAPFELRPHLEGASMLSPAGRQTPDPTPGAVRVTDAVDEGAYTRSVVLEGPAALLERQRLARVPKAGRTEALSTFWCGACKVTAADGLGAAGEPITLAFTAETPPTIDPLRPEQLASVFAGWHDWVGERTWTRTGDAAPGTFAEEPASWSREIDDHGVTERLEVTARRLPAGLWERWREARSAAPTVEEPANEAPLSPEPVEDAEDPSPPTEASPEPPDEEPAP